MDSLKSTFLSTTTELLPSLSRPKSPSKKRIITIKSSSSSPTVQPDPWSLSDGNPTRPKPRSKNPKNPLSDDNARRIIKKKAQYLSLLRKNQGPLAMTPRWIKRTPEQMVQYLEDDRNGQLYGKHVVAAIKAVKGMSQRRESDMRVVMGSFVGKLSFREMCVVLKEQKSWRQVGEFFGWMKLQLSYRPSVIVYTILLRAYGQIGKIKLAEQTFLEMLEVGCEPDEVACGTMLCAYARWGYHNAMLTFYDAVEERGIILSTAVYNFMLSSLQKKSHHEKLINLWMKMRYKKVPPSEFTFTLVISSLIKKGFREEAFKTFDEMRNTGFLPEEVTYSLLISFSVKNNDVSEAIRLYDDLRSRGIVPSNYTCASMLTLYYKTEDYSKALSLFSEMERYKIAADEVIYGLLIRIYGKLGLYEDAQRTFEETKQLGLLTDAKTYLAISQVHLNSGNVDKALEIIKLMKSQNIGFSRYAYIVLLQCNAMKGDLSSAEDAFQALTRTELPDAGACTVMLNLYLKLNLTEKAKKFIDEIQKDRVDFDEELYKTVMRAYCKERMVRDAEQLTEEMAAYESFKNNNFIQTFIKAMRGEYNQTTNFEDIGDSNRPDPVALGMLLNLTLADESTKAEEILKLLFETANGALVTCHLISSLVREGDTSKAEALGDLITKLGCNLEEKTAASCISLYGKQRRLKQAEQLFAAVRESPTSGKFLFNSMIDAYAKCSRPVDAYSIYKESIKKKLDLGPIAISIVVNALTTGGKYREAEDIIRKSFEDNLDLDTVAYNTFIKAMLEAGKLYFASVIFEGMVASGVPPSLQTYNTMISVYGRGKKLDKAVEMFNTARNLGFSMDEKAYMNMISYYGKAGKRDEASHLFSEMLKEGIKPGAVSYNMMMNVYAKGGFSDEVEKLLEAMQRDGTSPDSSTYLPLIQSYTENSQFTKAEETLTTIEKKGISLSCSHFNILLSGFATSGMMSEAERIYDKILKVGLSPDLVCYRSMLRGYMNYGLTDDGISFYETIRENVEPDRFIMSAAVHIYRDAGKELEAEGVLHAMEKLGIAFLKNLAVGAKVKKQ